MKHHKSWNLNNAQTMMRQYVHHLLWDIMKVDQDMSYKYQLFMALLWLGH